MDKIKPNVIGLDLGGTNAVFGIVDSRGNIIATTAIKTQAYPKVEDFVEAGCAALEPVIEMAGGIGSIQGMGIGAPNGCYYTGTIEDAANLAWKGSVPLAKMFSEKLGIPVSLTNDANAAAMGEMTYGVAKGMRNFTGAVSLLMVRWYMAATDSQENLGMSSWTALPTEGFAAVAVKVAWRHTAQPQV